MACKATHGLLRAAGKGATSLPGKVALRLCPEALRSVSRGVNIIAVTGTNGKTTVCRMIEAALRAQGLSVLANHSGANLRHGICAQLIMNTDLRMRPRMSWAVIECDEAASARAFEEMRPRVIVVTNLFRDQLDRYGEVAHTRELILNAVKGSPDSVVCLNADCSLTASLSRDIGNKTRFFGLNSGAVHSAAAPQSSDAPRCIFCGTAYDYGFVSYAHLGYFRCPKCGWARPRPEVEIMQASESDVLLRIDGKSIRASLALPALYNKYNAAAAAAAVTAAGASAETAARALGDFECGFGRMERFALGRYGAQMILVKNPAACDQAMEYLAAQEGNFVLALSLNDRAADGRDVSWIWDAQFERLAQLRGLRRIYVSGDRAYDMALRLKYAGIDESCVQIEKNCAELVKILGGCGERVYILPTYTAMLRLRGEIVRAVGGSEFWE